ncbi:unnamed protein product [Vitrella brassicaformis CCMP3155]|uniref:Peptidase C1A papain C-terminal domain-containing protein n=1 Tax=Vitrella brassicaformis (strain CCMP3155) TaxID=1169540 RepID=A0A0G4FK64_VITBC|nr:unnamed protein product [Vitrella brassicaformis CCMP3155]|eukprot:CEM13951.1 unnamed protein product [Vitrella brassicaformis CCMP3155]
MGRPLHALHSLGAFLCRLSLILRALSLLCLAHCSRDLPVHCLHGDLLGEWLFHIGEWLDCDGGKADPFCGFSLPDSEDAHDEQTPPISTSSKFHEKRRVTGKLERIDVSMGDGAAGIWTPERQRVENSFCDTTLVGWWLELPPELLPASPHKNVTSRDMASVAQATIKSFEHMQRHDITSGCFYAERVKAAKDSPQPLSGLSPTYARNGGDNSWRDARGGDCVSHDVSSFVENGGDVFVSSWDQDDERERVPSVSHGGRRHKRRGKIDSRLKAPGQAASTRKPWDRKHFSWRSKADVEERTGIAFPDDGWDHINGLVPPPPDQRTCGSCYAYATTSMITARLWLRYINEKEVFRRLRASPEHAYKCSVYNQGCKGGYPFLVGKFTNEVGLRSEQCVSATREQLTRTNTTQLSHSDALLDAHMCNLLGGQISPRGALDCRLPEQPLVDPLPEECAYVIHVSQWTYVGSKGVMSMCSEEALREEIWRAGPVTVSIEPEGAFNAYRGGILNATYLPEKKAVGKDDLSWQKVDHSVLLVGWSEDQHKEEKYWVVQNSWGSVWGEDGYMRILRGAEELSVEFKGVAAEVALYKSDDPSRPARRGGDARAVYLNENILSLNTPAKILKLFKTYP